MQSLCLCLCTCAGEETLRLEQCSPLFLFVIHLQFPASRFVLKNNPKGSAPTFCIATKFKGHFELMFESSISAGNVTSERSSSLAVRF